MAIEGGRRRTCLAGSCFSPAVSIRRRSRVMRSRRPAQTASATSSRKRTDLASRPALSKYAWQRLRARALQRDGNRCRHCGSTAKLSIHQVVRPQDGGRDELSNLVTSCDRHHRLAHKAMGKGRQGFPARRGVVQPTSMPPDPPGLEYPSPISGKTVLVPKMGTTRTIPRMAPSGGPSSRTDTTPGGPGPGSTGGASKASSPVIETKSRLFAQIRPSAALGHPISP